MRLETEPTLQESTGDRGTAVYGNMETWSYPSMVNIDIDIMMIETYQALLILAKSKPWPAMASNGDFYILYTIFSTAGHGGATATLANGLPWQGPDWYIVVSMACHGQIWP